MSTTHPSIVRVGMKLDSYCGGAFGDVYNLDRVEAIGADWVVARNTNGAPFFYEGIPEKLLPYVVDPSEDPSDRR